MKTDYYQVQTSGEGIPPEIKETVLVHEGEQLVLNIKVDGPCLYHYPAGCVTTVCDPRIIVKA